MDHDIIRPTPMENTQFPVVEPIIIAREFHTIGATAGGPAAFSKRKSASVLVTVQGTLQGTDEPGEVTFALALADVEQIIAQLAGTALRAQLAGGE